MRWLLLHGIQQFSNHTKGIVISIVLFVKIYPEFKISKGLLEIVNIQSFWVVIFREYLMISIQIMIDNILS